MKHLDLFAGIGGFSLAASRVWKDHQPTFCEIDPFCRAVLRKHWPHAVIHSDIKELNAESFAPNAESKGGFPVAMEREPLEKNQDAQGSHRGTFDLLTGGFPCTPFSYSGRRRGTADDRYLWPQMLRVVQFAKPAWIIGENVGGLVTWNGGMVFETVCADLEGENYEVQSFVVPACALDAPHRRDRVWIVAHHADAVRPRLEESEPQQGARHGRQLDRDGSAEREAWREDWVEVATRLCGIHDGISARMDGLELSKSKHRNNRIKAIGNAIVPQVAEMIMRAISLTQNHATPKDQ